MSDKFGVHDWLPGPLKQGAPMPLSVSELTELYASNISLTEDEISELSCSLPYLGDLLTPAQFVQLLQEGEDLARDAELTPSPARGEIELLREPHQIRQDKFDSTMAAVEDLCGPSSAKVVMNLRSAIRAKSPLEYEEAHRRLADLTKKTKVYKMRIALIAKLAQAAPNWSAAITRRDGVHGGGSIPGDAAAAWQWRQEQQEQQESIETNKPLG
jgi:hypothetical protein